MVTVQRWVILPHEFISNHACYASLVRWCRVLRWRSGHRCQRTWPDAVAMLLCLFIGWIPYQELTGYQLTLFGRAGWRYFFSSAIGWQRLAGQGGHWPFRDTVTVWSRH